VSTGHVIRAHKSFLEEGEEPCWHETHAKDWRVEETPALLGRKNLGRTRKAPAITALKRVGEIFKKKKGGATHTREKDGKHL